MAQHSGVVQYTPSPTTRRFIASEAFYNVICGPRGEGKTCQKVDERCVRADGRLVAVGDVQRGDYLMGMDSTPREVVAVEYGEEELYTIIPCKGLPFTVTAQHRVTVKNCVRSWSPHRLGAPRRANPHYGTLVDIPVWRIAEATPSWFNTYRLVHVPLDFPAQPVPIDPYFLGLWLGDGDSASPTITSADSEIARYLCDFAASVGIGLRVANDPRGNAAKRYHLTCGAASLTPVGGHNPLLTILRRLRVVKNKHIPDAYKYNTRGVRLALLAGLIDTDGWVNRCGYQITQKRRELADDIAYVGRSLGFQCAVKPITASIRASSFTGTYYRVYINGDGATIPVKLRRKRVAARSEATPQWKNVLHDGIRAVIPAGKGEFAGIQLAGGDRRYLLEDCTVTHNTAGLMRTYYRAMLPEHRPFLPVKWAVLRATRKEIGLTTARTIHEWIPDRYAKWRGKAEEPEQVTIYEHTLGPLLIFDFFGVNSQADYDRFQSYEASGGVWVEEPAGARTNTEFISSGIGPDVLPIAVTSIRGAPFPSVQITMNPPPADHWTAQLFHIPGWEAAAEFESDFPASQLADREALRRNAAVFMIPPGENKALDLKTPGYRERNRMILAATGATDVLARLVEGRVGYVQMGERVTPAFGAHHLSPGLTVLPNVPFLLSFDYGLNPTCIVSQTSPQGYLLIHRCWSRPNVGMKQLLMRDVQPWLALQPVRQWSYCGGPEATERDQSDSEESALRVIIQTLGFAPYHRGPVSWSARKDALDDGLNRATGGLPWVRVNPEGAAKLTRALDGGWHYPTNTMGRVMREAPDKRSPHDHIGDAFAHLLAVLLRKTDAQSRTPRISARASRALPSGYGYQRTGTGA